MRARFEHVEQDAARYQADLGWNDRHCLSCEGWTYEGLFCTECLERSKQRYLSELDDLGVGD